MSASLSLTFVSTLAFAIQFLIFVYLYPSHRVRFFTYFVWAWALFTCSKGFKLAETLLPDWVNLYPLINFDMMAATFFVLAAGLAYRFDYRIGRRELFVVGAVTIVVSILLGDLYEAEVGIRMAAGTFLGAVHFLGGLMFWPSRPKAIDYRGARFLAVSLCAWGLQRTLGPLIDPAPGTAAYMTVHGLFIFFYFLSTFAIIIMVLDRARSETRALKEFNERLVDGLGEGLLLVDGDFRVHHTNRWMQERFGPVVGRRCHELLTVDGQPCPGCPLGRRAAMEGPERLDVEGSQGRRFNLTCSPVRKPDGQVFLLDLVADVTEQERLRARLAEAQRLAATGELAAGVAHEIRNPLAAIVNATTLLQPEELLTGEERATTLNAIKTEARRLNRILSDFLVFARPGEPQPVDADVSDLVGHVATLIREDPARARGLQLDVTLDPTVPRIAFDPDQMTQVLWNIALNGVEAMDGHGRLAFDVRQSNRHVAVAIADTGHGLQPDELRRVFEPFYSRKRGGSGLGLTIARRIVEGHGGRIDVESTPGAGARFTILLPVKEG